MKDNIVAALDIGTTKIAVLIVKVGSRDDIQVIGVGTYPSIGLRRGVVVNIELTVEATKKAIAEAERMAGVKIDSVYVGIAGDHIRSIDGRGVVSVHGNEITEDDVRRAIDAAQAGAISIDREVIHVIPQEFIVDNQGGIREPIGLAGNRLEAEVHIVMGAVNAAQNLYRCIERAGVRVKDLILEPLASSYGVLDRAERELGVMLFDIGGGSTDVAIFFDESIRFTDMIGYAGASVTGDISSCLVMPYDSAEKIKKDYGCSYPELVDETEFFEIPGISGRKPRRVSRKFLSEVIEARMEEIFYIAYYKAEESGFLDAMSCGLVITGGGALLQGTAELAEKVFKKPVRIGHPKMLTGLIDEIDSPIFSTAVGIVHYAILRDEQTFHSDFKKVSKELSAKKLFPGGPRSNGDDHSLGDDPYAPRENQARDDEVKESIMNRMKKWLDEFF